MRKIKHKILSIILSVAMVTTFLPSGMFNTVFAKGSADGGDISTTGLNLSVNTPSVPTTYTAGSGTILWEPAHLEDKLVRGTITMTNATIDTTTTSKDGIILPTGLENKTVDVSVVLKGNNTIKTPNGTGIAYNNGSGVYSKSLTISEDSLGGNLTIDAKYAGIYLLNPVTVQSGTLNIKTKEGLGIGTQDPNNHITINGGNTNIESKENALQAFVSDVKITGGNVTLFGGKSIQAGGKVALSGKAKIDTSNNIAIMGGIPNALSDIFTKADTVTGTVNKVKVEVLNSLGKVRKTYNMDGTPAVPPLPPKVTIDGVEYPVISDITKTEIDLSGASEPPFPVAFKAGDGYVIYDPTTATLTLSNAVIENEQSQPLINLPLKDVKIKLVGENLLSNLTDAADATTTIIEQGGSYDIDDTQEKKAPEDFSITVSGTGTLTAISRDTMNAIATRGTFIMESGTIRNDAGMSPPCLGVTDFQMRGGDIVSSYLNIFGDTAIKGGTVVNLDTINVLGDFSMSAGSVTCSSELGKGLAVGGAVKKTGGTLNTFVGTLTTSGTSRKITLTLYDDVIAGEYDSNGKLIGPPRMMVGTNNSNDICLNIPTGKTLTFPNGSTFYTKIPEGKTFSNYITNNGTFINNGEINLPSEATKETVDEIVRVLKPKGTGFIAIGHEETFYSNDGKELAKISGDIDLSIKKPVTDNNGYSFTGNDTTGYTLTLNGVVMSGQLTLPTGVPITIITNTASILNNFNFTGGYACNLTITGSAPLSIDGIVGGTNGDTVNVVDGVNVTINGGRIFLGGSGGQGGLLHVNGTGTTLSVYSNDETAIYCDTLNVENGANITANASSRGVFALDGGVNVTNGSTLSTGCDYGVYIIDGKLNVDETSKLITNGAIAPFCIIDHTATKLLANVINLPTLPNGTKITSVTGTETGSDCTYWSLTPTGGELGVTDENNEPVTLTGAIKGLLTFAKVTNGGNGGGTTSDSEKPTTPETPTTPIAPEKPKPIISKPNPQTGDNRDAILLVTLLLVLAGGVLTLLLKRRKDCK
ncbi:LPXTG cell wall anchor domain-containing protein [Paludicola sp. MB14-C6]|uniref:LPXTG cell wall anchor domain-containing protein n=1 Tax=Paludihabitans sp. MB14-C6 TaxID=3070656 RepID=UPI0027DC53F3|nr:LPXTG cell wall anchor domain-containing protein [Paludicola sp. MB14-C6]WMJ21913.1 LPXTG cell wall anchor domain-containing protein [Paludicola sp. MB14-C6]